MEGISSKRALVTGGSRGIGLDIARKLVDLGAEVFIVGRDMETLKKEVEESGNKMKAIKLDVGDWNATRKAIEKVLPIQLLVNNAGFYPISSVSEITEAECDQTFNVNWKAAVNITQIVTNDLVAKGLEGRVVNISSLCSKRSFAKHLVYCSSKAALDMTTSCFAFELGSKNIRVNSVNPTVVLTDMGKTNWLNPANADPLLQRIPIGRFAEVSEVVNATIYFLSDQSGMITGQTLLVDGGYTTN